MEQSGVWTRRVAAWLASATMVGMAPGASAEGSLLHPWLELGAPPAPWHVVGLPGQTKPYTRFSVVDVAGVRAMRLEADHSYGNLVHPTGANATPNAGTLHLTWRWRIEQPLVGADLSVTSAEDTEARVCVSFDEPLEQVPFVERQLLRLARTRTSEPLPGATVCYVWSGTLQKGSVQVSPFTGRIRYIVLEAGAADTMRSWVAERRDVIADFKRAFGEETRGAVPALVGVLVGADADNTRGHSVAYVADLRLD